MPSAARGCPTMTRNGARFAWRLEQRSSTTVRHNVVVIVSCLQIPAMKPVESVATRPEWLSPKRIVCTIGSGDFHHLHDIATQTSPLHVGIAESAFECESRCRTTSRCLATCTRLCSQRDWYNWTTLEAMALRLLPCHIQHRVDELCTP